VARQNKIGLAGERRIILREPISLTTEEIGYRYLGTSARPANLRHKSASLFPGEPI
jgi:hypothetical protein